MVLSGTPNNIEVTMLVSQNSAGIGARISIMGKVTVSCVDKSVDKVGIVRLETN